MNSPLGQALQIVILGIVLLTASAFWFFWSANIKPSADGDDAGSLVVVVCLAGTVGGVANNFRRLQKLALQNWEELDPTERWFMTLQIYVSPVLGALFAFVLYGAFAAGILQGELFPTFKSGPFKNLYNYADTMIPQENSDVAKAFFWSFVAGFAEQFVPNFIDKVVKKVEEAE